MTMVAPSTSTLSEWRKPRQPLGGKDLLTHLYNRLDGAYPGRFSTQFRTAQAIDNWKDAWEEGFVRENIQPREVADALTRLPVGWPPGLPDFLVLCRPAMDAEAAFHEAVAGMSARAQGERGNWSHQAVYWAAVRIGRADILAHAYPVLRARWENALRDIMSQGKWRDIPDADPVALPAPGRTVAGREECERRVQEMGAAGLLPQGPGKLSVGWAVKVLKGGKRSPAVEMMARRALERITLEEPEVVQ
ncbi:MAG: hypothetical protein E2576_14380 [Alcaligenaceae bacterium]|nr:hypothetical protein [Alcaligenaceae bacterium SAGV5]MPS50433.1 hypothetical protein [Alcaligenaceae bacterium SAGV3]MPT57906.1 hypothetical protein [Alcaligenaceae bacterium]